ncbi:hypothetical protein D3C77_513010 [compost metagenome]
MIEDLATDEDQYQGQRILQVDETVHECREGEIQRAQPENGEDVRGIDNEWILSDGKDCRHAVYGKYQVGQLDQHQRQEQGGGKEHGLVLSGSLDAYKKTRAMQVIGNP